MIRIEFHLVLWIPHNVSNVYSNCLALTEKKSLSHCFIRLILLFVVI